MKNITIEDNKVIVDGVEYVKKSDEKPTGWRMHCMYYWHWNEYDKNIWVAKDKEPFVDIHRYEAGNYFATEKEAIRAKERQLARVRFERRVKELNDGWEPVWDMKTENWLLVYRHDEKKLHLVKWSTNQYPPNEWYVKSEELAKQLRDECGDDYKLMIGVL